MGLYNFKERFAPFIMDGRKNHTIRGKRKHRAKAGETLHLYTGLRTKKARLLRRAPCSLVQDIRFTDDFDGAVRPKVYIEGEQLAPDECEQLARCDGFESFGDMMKFWRGNLPFSGDLIHWEPPK